MKASFHRRFLVTLSSFVMLVGMVLGYQNCSNDAGFNADPSVARPFVNSAPPRIGGNENVIIRVNEYPTDQTLDDGNAVVDFVVTSPNGEIVDIKCLLDGKQVDCNPVDRIPINVEQLGLGTHTFTIEATNSQGQTGVETITFTVFDAIIAAQKIITVNSVNDDADIIIVVDNSGSMEYEQKSMADRVATFMDKFKNSNYRISVITTAPLGGGQNTADKLWTDGKFIPFPNGSYCLDNSIPLDVAQQYIGDTVQREEEGNGWERGIYMAVRALERSQIANSPESQCLRQNVAKHFILISDEDETTINEDNNVDPLIDANKSVPSYILSLNAQLFPNTALKYHSIIVDPLNQATGPACLNSHGAKYGDEYAALSVLTGGVRGSVCAVDYGSQLEQIGQSISDSAKVYPLDCVAVSNGTQPSSVTQNGAPIGLGYSFNGTNIEFADNLPVGTYVVNYYCFK